MGIFRKTPTASTAELILRAQQVAASEEFAEWLDPRVEVAAVKQLRTTVEGLGLADALNVLRAQRDVPPPI